MEKKQSNKRPTGACEKIYKVVAGNRAFRSIHRLSHGSGDASVNPNRPGGRANNSPCKTRFFLRKLVARRDPRPAEVNIPIQSGPSNSIMMNAKEKMANPSFPKQSNIGTVIMISSPKIQSADDSTTKKQAKSPIVSAEEKPNQKAEKVPPSNMIVVQSPGQGITAIATPPHVPVQGLQPKPKSQPAASVVKFTAKREEPTNKTQGKQDKKQENGDAQDHNLIYTNYIDYVKTEMGTKSNVGEEAAAERPPARTSTRRDSFNDRASNFIMQARTNIKMTHFGD